MKSSCELAKGDSLLDHHTIVKYVKPDHINDDGTIDGIAFLSRPVDKGDVSYNWLDFFDGTIEKKLQELRKVINITRAKSGVFAKLNVGSIRDEIQVEIPETDIIYDPTEKSDELNLKQDYSHCIMTNIPNMPNKADDSDELSFLQEAVIELIRESVGTDNQYPARQPD